MTTEEQTPPVKEKIDVDDIFEELEEEEQRELEKLAEEAIKETQQKRKELEEFAKSVTLADILECIEKIQKFIQLYHEAIRTKETLKDLLAEDQEDPSKAFLRMFLNKPL